MRVSLPAGVAITLASVFSAYHLVLAFTSIRSDSGVAPVLFGMALYALATVCVLLPRPVSARLPLWSATLSIVAAVLVPVVTASSVTHLTAASGYVTWWIAGICTLMVIVVVRRRPVFAWLGVVAVVAHTALWAGPAAVVTLGAAGSVCWVACAAATVRVTRRAAASTEEFMRAAQAAAAWQAEQDARVHERQFRLEQTRAIARPMLQRIVEARGVLSDEERAECMHLEQAIRDEIRGRALLSPAVRAEVMRLRQRGVTVRVHDDGGIDDLGAEERARVSEEIVDALRLAAEADSVVVRTADDEDDEGLAVTVVGLRGSVGTSEAVALGAGIGDDDADDDDDPVVVWRHIRRRDPRADQG